MVAGWGFAFGELGSMVYAGKVFEFGFEWGFWVWLERERRLKERHLCLQIWDLGFG